jgi:hypothetical protein
MQHAGRVRRRNTVRDTRDELEALPPGVLASGHPVVERAGVDELAHDELPPIVLADVVHSDDVRMVKARCCFGFLAKTAPSLSVHVFRGQKLDRNGAMELRIGGAVHDAHAAAAEQTVEAVDAELQTQRQFGRSRGSVERRFADLSRLGHAALAFTTPGVTVALKSTPGTSTGRWFWAGLEQTGLSSSVSQLPATPSCPPLHGGRCSDSRAYERRSTGLTLR